MSYSQATATDVLNVHIHTHTKHTHTHTHTHTCNTHTHLFSLSGGDDGSQPHRVTAQYSILGTHKCKGSSALVVETRTGAVYM